MFWTNLNQQNGFILYQFFAACGCRVLEWIGRASKPKFLSFCTLGQVNLKITPVPWYQILPCWMVYKWDICGLCNMNIEFYFKTGCHQTTNVTKKLDFVFFSFLFLVFVCSGDLGAVLTSCLLALISCWYSFIQACIYSFMGKIPEGCGLPLPAPFLNLEPLP